MEPFDSYPNGGRQLFGRRPYGKTTRLHSGPWFMQNTGQTACAYCGLNLVGCFENWVQISFDHVVPKHVCKKFGLNKDWTGDLTNYVLACDACNGHENQYEPLPEWTQEYTSRLNACAACNGSPNPKCPQCLEAFYSLRDRIFPHRKNLVLECRNNQRAFFLIGRAIDWRIRWTGETKMMRVRINDDKVYTLAYNPSTREIEVREGQSGRVLRSFTSVPTACEVKEFFELL